MEKTQYELKLENRSDLGRDIYKFVSADGVASKNSFREPELALADNVKPETEDSILVAQAGFGFLGVLMADKTPEGKTVIAETSDRAYQIIQRNIEENQVKNASALKTAFYQNIDQEFDKILYAPRNYEPVNIVKNRLSQLIELLEMEGELYIAGTKNTGVKRYQKHLKTAGTVEKISGGKQKVYKFQKQEDTDPEYFDVETHFTATVKDLQLDFKAREGLFSPKNLDKGTKLLLETIELKEEEKVLDLACGYGTIGVYLNKLYNTETYLSDDDAVAAYYAGNNLQMNEVNEYVLKNKDCLDGFKNQKFDAIVSNPPTHQGKQVTDEIFKNSHKRLRNGGKLYLVYNQNMGYENQLEQIFSQVEILENQDNFYVVEAEK